MDKFFTQKFCDRCSGSLVDGRIMPMFNKECICMACCEKEKQDKDYDKASKADRDEIKKGNYNYEGLRGQEKNDK
ncbi:gamma-glutamylcyclotransferase [Clostridium estertheticum]|uniref:gamma-glutamylcyclotransferase n=1 Tax=Clostridium estertheticum TaxID=238834 RepID=UPI001C6E8658|nr:gamma-glutamylcyclotransferase [Clostridium estertheticum]MBW9171201.1 gamma-glutamylcyclotransferase [Clostridium estertheticum]WLC73941.1 gamma-glutamylcyclotransferase [Clostridium estertheticum]